MKSSSILRIAGRLLAGLVILSTTLWGAGFWDKKDFTQWSPKEISKVMNDSPWAKVVNVPVGGAVASSTNQRGGGATRSGAGGGGGGGRPGGGGGGGGAVAIPANFIKLAVRFLAAKPVKEAIIKANLGESTEPTPPMQQYLDHLDPYYVVEVEGLPVMFERFTESPEILVQTARLRRKGKEDIQPQKVEAVVAGRIAKLQYYFPRDAAIELADKDVEFVMRFERSAMMAIAGQGQGRQGQGQRGQQGQGQRAGGQGGGQGQQQRQRAGGQGAQGQGQRAGGPQAARNAALFGKDIKRKFRLKDMVYKGELVL